MAARLDLIGDVVHVAGPLTMATVGDATVHLRQLLLKAPHTVAAIDLSKVSKLDTAGVVWVQRAVTVAAAAGHKVGIRDLPDSLYTYFIDVVSPESQHDLTANESARSKPNAEVFLDRLGDRAYRDVNAAMEFLYLAADLSWAALQSIFRRRGIRRGSFIEQAAIIGADGLSIVALVLFLVGGVSTLQAAAQLRQFGANVLVADLLAIGITRELGPLMTAIMIAGRSGSAFAAEIATMKFTEEIDALRTMALDPLKLIAVPKLWAMLLTLPLLTIMANFIGLLGGALTGVLSLDISPATFFSRLTNALLLKDIITGLIKSLSFAWIITVIAVFRGLQFRGGATGVGKATTSAVVSSIFAIVVLDLIWGLLFYLK